MKVSAEGLKAIAQEEGLRLKAYRDPVGVLTIGYGHTNAAGGFKFAEGAKITKAQAEEILAEDLEKFENYVEEYVKRPMSQADFDALVSFCYNVGPNNFRKSSVLREYNNGNEKNAADALLKWNKAGGRVLPGLTSRRRRERERMLSDGTGQETEGSDRKPTKGEVKHVQTRLWQLGYTEVGQIDGKLGPKTRAALTIFKADHGLPKDDKINYETVAALKHAKARPIPVSRAGISASELRERGSKTIPATTGGLIASAGGAAATITAAIEKVSEGTERVTASLNPFAIVFDRVMDYLPYILLVLLLGLAAYLFWRIRELRVEQERTGRTTTNPVPIAARPTVDLDDEEPAEVVP